jgi:hypothetical protein
MQETETALAKRFDLTISSLMVLTSITMIFIGISSLLSSFNTKSIALLVFGIIGLNSSYSDIKIHKQSEKLSYKLRISKHLELMLGATIATLTAFFVINVHVQYSIIVWLGPTFLISLVIYF